MSANECRMSAERNREKRAMTRWLAIAAAASVWGIGALQAQAADVAAGKDKAEKVCAACHGADGNKSLTPDYPRLAGQNVDYLVKALTDYKSGARKDAVMGAQAQQLSAQDIANVAAWFSSQQGLVTKY